MRQATRSLSLFLLAISLYPTLTGTGLWAGHPLANADILPPAPPWSGQSRSLAVAPDHEWATHFEKNDLMESPDHAATLSWFRRLCDASPKLHLKTIGTSHEGRAIVMVVASDEGVFSPEMLKKSTKPLVLIQAGIHSGEIDGKDASMMLLRDMTVRGNRAELLKSANLLIIPILNVDGHERRSAYNRINQRGPRVMGWRTNTRNLNLNRDYSKLETPGILSVVDVINRYDPDLYIDIHVTDGIDYQYDITYGFNQPHGPSPNISTWMREKLQPRVDGGLRNMGHVPGPLIFAVDPRNLEAGIVDWTATPRFSNGYGEWRRLPTILVENHSLKPYDQRVLGTYVFLEGILDTCREESASLRKAIAQDMKLKPNVVPVAWGPAQASPPPTIEFLGIAYEKETSSLSGGTWLEWTGKPATMQLPLVRFNRPTAEAQVPRGYWVPATWPEIIAKLERHGIELKRSEKPITVKVDMLRLSNVSLAEAPFEGRVRVSATVTAESQERTFPMGSAWVPTDQPLGLLAVALLDPQAPDSFFQWGYFLEILQRTEYFETYVGEPLAAQMAERDPQFKAAFDKKVAEDPEFAKNPRERLDFFFRKSPYMDATWRLYPVGRVMP
ncbi:M14 family metallopeptidase [Sulfidibacter corallicola]|uniref:M14 family metallopeptidase n=1 Tax=Sulfidibacter corallicola TaxID=2818388 RepID=A0A8A4TFB3_SULCO|nr:M14 family metallopeptidase [Sulfidibacter corallicola]QTD48227.1 M14 family metallopeptidase [Sulfidibacter corallicola]